MGEYNNDLGSVDCVEFLDVNIFRRFLDAGLSVIPVDGKRSLVGWKRFQERAASAWEVSSWVSTGVAVVCGYSGVELTEFEACAMSRIDEVRERLEVTCSGLWERIVSGWSEWSPSGGFHLLYRLYSPVEGNTVLARVNGGVAAETRGTGGYVVVAPSTLTDAAGMYRVHEGGAETIAIITTAERELLHDAIRTVYGTETDVKDSSARRVPTVKPRGTFKPGGTVTGSVRPGDWFNQVMTWADVLEPHGWQVHHVEDGVTYWTRPGKSVTGGFSATTGYTEADNLHVFTANASPFEAGENYKKFAAFALLNCHGDWSEATRVVRGLKEGHMAA